MDTITNAMIHAALANTTKAVGNCVSACGKSITTATKVIADGVHLTADELMIEKNLKNCAVKSCHGQDMRNDPPTFLAQKVTESVTDYWVICFMCVVATVTNPSIILQNATNIENVATYVPKPNDDEVAAFLSGFKKRKWSSYVVNENFQASKGANIRTKEDYINFINSLCKHGQEIFLQARKQCRRSREEAHKYLWQKLGECNVLPNLNEFQVQVIMRTIEMCILEPFGQVEKVPLGYGSREAADFIKKVMGEEDFGSHEELPMYIVQRINERAENIMNDRPNNTTKEQFEHELVVLGLKWDENLSCLVHRRGIGKKLDPSDTEHLLCLFYRLLQNTFPNYNTNSTDKIRLHNPKHWPIRVDGCIVSDLPLMKPFKDDLNDVLFSYRVLLNDVDYIHNTLYEVFRIDIIENLYDEDEEVYAAWWSQDLDRSSAPPTGWYPGKIKDYKMSSQQYSVVFDDGINLIILRGITS